MYAARRRHSEYQKENGSLATEACLALPIHMFIRQQSAQIAMTP